VPEEETGNGAPDLIEDSDVDPLAAAGLVPEVLAEQEPEETPSDE
jgi:hypothetical protein